MHRYTPERIPVPPTAFFQNKKTKHLETPKPKSEQTTNNSTEIAPPPPPVDIFKPFTIQPKNTTIQSITLQETYHYSKTAQQQHNNTIHKRALEQEKPTETNTPHQQQGDEPPSKRNRYNNIQQTTPGIDTNTNSNSGKENIPRRTQHPIGSKEYTTKNTNITIAPLINFPPRYPYKETLKNTNTSTHRNISQQIQTQGKEATISHTSTFTPRNLILPPTYHTSIHRNISQQNISQQTPTGTFHNSITQPSIQPTAQAFQTTLRTNPMNHNKLDITSIPQHQTHQNHISIIKATTHNPTHTPNINNLEIQHKHTVYIQAHKNYVDLDNNPLHILPDYNSSPNTTPTTNKFIFTLEKSNDRKPNVSHKQYINIPTASEEINIQFHNIKTIVKYIKETHTLIIKTAEGLHIQLFSSNLDRNFTITVTPSTQHEHKVIQNTDGTLNISSSPNTRTWNMFPQSHPRMRQPITRMARYDHSHIFPHIPFE